MTFYRDYKPVPRRRHRWLEQVLEFVCVFIAVLMLALQF